MGVEHDVVSGGNFSSVCTATQIRPEAQDVLTFAESEKFFQVATKNPGVSSVLITSEIRQVAAEKFTGGLCVVTSPKTVFYKIHNYITEAAERQGSEMPQIDATAVIHPTAIIPDHNISIGRNVRIHANVVIYPNTSIGDEVVIRENCVVGSPAFYYFQDGGRSVPVLSAGRVIIREYSEIQPLVSIERGVFGGATVIGPNVKIDNNCLISHDSQIGSGSILAGSTSLAGFVTIGKDVFAGMGVTISPEKTIGDGVKLSSGAVVTKDVPANTHVSGNFAVEHGKYCEFIRSIR
jgi:UDP-3-O-[3-hydroxymyristoyl] glucosamine N-acyltransferase